LPKCKLLKTVKIIAYVTEYFKTKRQIDYRIIKGFTVNPLQIFGLPLLVWELGPKKFDFSDIFGGELQHGLF